MQLYTIAPLTKILDARDHPDSIILCISMFLVDIDIYRIKCYTPSTEKCYTDSKRPCILMIGGASLQGMYIPYSIAFQILKCSRSHFPENCFLWCYSTKDQSKFVNRVLNAALNIRDCFMARSRPAMQGCDRTNHQLLRVHALHGEAIA